MKKTAIKKPLPKLEIRTLDYRELSSVTGGLPPREETACSVSCMADYSIDSDP
jgi:hypothetical protein